MAPLSNLKRTCYYCYYDIHSFTTVIVLNTTSVFNITVSYNKLLKAPETKAHAYLYNLE